MEETIKRLLAQVMEDDAQPENWNSDTDIINDIGIDSLQIVKFMMAVEDELDIKLNYEEMTFDDFSSIRALSDFLERQK